MKKNTDWVRLDNIDLDELSLAQCYDSIASRHIQRATAKEIFYCMRRSYLRDNLRSAEFWEQYGIGGLESRPSVVLVFCMGRADSSWMTRLPSKDGWTNSVRANIDWKRAMLHVKLSVVAAKKTNTLPSGAHWEILLQNGNLIGWEMVW